MTTLKDKARLYWQIITQTFSEFSADKCLSLAAALSYYTLFSIAPMLIVIYAAASLFWGDDAVRGELFKQLQGFIGAESAASLQELMRRAYQPRGNVIATIIGLAALLIGATTVFTQLQSSLNQIWKVKAKTTSGWQGIKEMLRDRLLSFALFLGAEFTYVHAKLSGKSVPPADYAVKIEKKEREVSPSGHRLNPFPG